MKRTFFRLFFDRNSKKIKLNRNVYIFFFCLLLSFFFWLLASLSEQYSDTLTVKFKYVQMDAKMMFEEQPHSEIQLLVKGNGFDLLGEQLRFDRHPVEIDLSSALSIGENRFMIPMKYLNYQIEKELGGSLSIEELFADSITFKLAEVKEKLLAVQPKLKLSFENGYGQSGEVKVQPESVMVYAAERIVDQLMEISTEQLSFSKLSDTLKVSASLLVDSTLGAINFQAEKVNLEIPVEKFTEKEFDLKVDVLTFDSSLKLKTFPNKVKVVFSVPLSKYDQFNQHLILAEVYYDQGMTNKSKLSVELKGVPDYVELKRLEPEKVEFIVLN